jgi:AsmA protein
MKKGLAGVASVAIKNGALKGINLAKSFRELKAQFSAKQDAVQKAKMDDKTDFSELTASFRIAGGVARNNDLAAKSPFLRLAGAGDIDIGNSRLDYLAKASVVATSGGQGAKDLEHLKGVTVPVRVSGPFDALTYKLEIASLARESVKARVEEKKQEVKERAKEKRQEVKQRAKEKLLKELFR